MFLGSKPKTSAVGSPVLSPVLTPPKTSQVMLIQAPGPLKTISLSPLPQGLPVQSATGQRIILHQIQAAAGTQYYRRPDGKLVQLIPIRQVKPVATTTPTQTGEGARLGDRWGRLAA